MEVGRSVMGILLPKDLEGKGKKPFEYIGPAEVDWKGKKIEACNFAGSIGHQAYDAKIFASRLVTRNDTLIKLEPNSIYDLEFRDEKTFWITPSSPRV